RRFFFGKRNWLRWLRCQSSESGRDGTAFSADPSDRTLRRFAVIERTGISISMVSQLQSHSRRDRSKLSCDEQWDLRRAGHQSISLLVALGYIGGERSRRRRFGKRT